MSACEQFLTGCVQTYVLGGSKSNTLPVISGIHLGSVLGTLFIILFTSDLYEIVENKVLGCVDDLTLVVFMPRPIDLPRVFASVNRDLERINN